MPLKDDIKSAIVSHSIWKNRLRRAIETGKFDTPPDTVAQDDQCLFGKWLYGGTLTPVVRDSEEYKQVKEFHAEFHRVAAKVVELAMSGNTVEAHRLMGLNGEYTRATSKLISALTAWADKVS